MIAIIDYGVGNLGSVQKAFDFLGYQARITSDPQVVREAEKVVLPGVGAFGSSMLSLEKAGMIPVVKEVIHSGRPFLGICLGLQMLFEESAEVFDSGANPTHGLGIIPGRVLRFPPGKLKVPQIGWNQIWFKQDSPLVHGIADGSFVYFVNSYYVRPDDAGQILCNTDYGFEYCSGITFKGATAFQFHPEKSSQVGLKILKNFGVLKQK